MKLDLRDSNLHHSIQRAFEKAKHSPIALEKRKIKYLSLIEEYVWFFSAGSYAQVALDALPNLDVAQQTLQQLSQSTAVLTLLRNFNSQPLIKSEPAPSVELPAPISQRDCLNPSLFCRKYWKWRTCRRTRYLFQLGPSF
ncbi:hypothetical protein A0H81_02239 [Grifola frondosa]|uniref:Uncharacterized protein n=1 Tax=Grifola frondosa TaxID=5627 RepID=A0A1C7MRI4_GRIFR|nr:hypothetical protein A0H81_02239 [Grifola frondosa]